MAAPRWFERVSDATVHAAGSAWAVAVSVGLTALWFVSGPFFGWSDTWQLLCNTATTIITFWMVFVIQHSQNRDGAALQAKLDALIKALPEASNRLIQAEKLSEDEIAALRERGDDA